MRTKYLAVMMTTMAATAMLLTSLGNAQVSPTVNIYAWTDKSYYNPGEKGTLKLIIRNDRTDTDLILQNITVTYPWFAYVGDKWEGNSTIAPSPPVVLSKNAGNIYTTTVEFTVPTDGRVISGMYGPTSISIVVSVDKSPFQYTKTALIYIKGTPSYVSFEDVDKVVTLFTIQVVLTIVCTIIIAATIFLSMRRPQVAWSKEEKAE